MKITNQTEFQKSAVKKQISKIVITGGPCAGKTTAMSWIQNAFSERGYVVLFVPETATELITGGVAPWNCASNQHFQEYLFQLQMAKEEVYEQAAADMNCGKVLIVCDRGFLDNKAYMTEEEFKLVASNQNSNEVELRDRYDGVFHLVTAAKGAEEYYTLSNNAARTETPEQAAALDDKLIAAWTGHPHLRVIDNTTAFEEKMRRLIREIALFLGEPKPYEIERKFLIEYPDLQLLEKLPNCQKVHIMQTYLVSPWGEEIRIRQRGIDGNYIYFKTIKRKISDIKRLEIEERLSKEQYLELLMQADPACRPIQKKRYCLTYEAQYFEIDIYPFWDKQAIVEIELADDKEEIHFPDFLNVIKEVTDDETYKNYSLAKGV